MLFTTKKSREQTVDELLKILEFKRDKPLKPSTTLSEQARLFAYKKKRKYKPKTPVVFQKKIHEFIHAKALQPGSNQIEAFILLYYFKEWYMSKGNKVKKNIITFRNFCQILKTYFPFKFTKHSHLFFGINKDIRQDYLTPQKEAAIRRWKKDENPKAPSSQKSKKRKNKTINK